MIDETHALLDLWSTGLNGTDLYRAALASGRFPSVSARRLRNVVMECFAPRFLRDGGRSAHYVKVLRPVLKPVELVRWFFICACRANAVLADFVRDVFWPNYSAGRDSISNEEARSFVTRANQNGLTSRLWSEGTVRRVAAYLTGCCADFGLLERGTRRDRRILPIHLEERPGIILAYDLHFAGHGGNGVMAHEDWALFGMDRTDVRDELVRLSRTGAFIVQSAADVIRIEWPYQNVEELADAIAQG